LTIPIVVQFTFINNVFPTAQRIFRYYKYSTSDILLRDSLFVEGAMLLVFAVQFAEPLWKWRRTRKDGNHPSGLIVGLTLLTSGVIYVLSAVLLPSGIIR
jgi:hypothetical protein